MTSIQTSAETSFVKLFEKNINGLSVNRIEIPLIQRDYAQGRSSDTVKRVRDDFLDALCGAVMSADAAISLDFVFGDVEADAQGAVFFPLDGQQRLTTLFLLHCYLAWRAGVTIQDAPWTKFTYATRSGARHFCEFLVKHLPPEGEPKLSTWLEDQAWYLYTWKHDPTIQSMLVMLDALHGGFSGASKEDCAAAWRRLNNEQHPPIRFHVLPMKANGLTDDLYIKMNSRGKPLTSFETFKAHFEETLKAVDPAKADDFAKKVDTDWANTLWDYHGGDYLIDEEFMRYFRFVTEVRAWTNGVPLGTRIETLADQVYSASVSKPQAAIHLDFLIQAFDVWHQNSIKQKSIQTVFESLLTPTPGVQATPLLMFNPFKISGQSPVDLFGACCRHYGEPEWTLAHTLLLYAILVDRIHAGRANASSFPRQLRLLRNLIEASLGGWIREAYMPKLLADVERIVVGGTLDGVTAFNPDQIAHEKEKLSLSMPLNPVLQACVHRLEDHRLLRGCLLAFNLDPATFNPAQFTSRAEAFHVLFANNKHWHELTGALLAMGDYSRRENRWTGYRFADFGAPKNDTPWRHLLSERKEPRLVDALMKLLDRFAAANNNMGCLQTIQHDFLRECEEKMELTWRYYFVKYAAMREGGSGRYAIHPRGYRVCMLDRTVMRSYYRDPYLLAVWHLSGIGNAVEDPLFYGYETAPRRMILKNSRIEIECADDGWRMTKPPTDQVQKANFEQICNKHGIGDSGAYTVRQKNGADESDRVILGAQLLLDLANSGL